MKKDILQANLLGRLRGQFPNNAELVKQLITILQIEKEAVYRRLRGEVPFSFPDVMLIGSHLGISLDNLIGIDASKARPFLLYLTDYETPTKQDYKVCDDYLKLVKTVTRNKTAKVIETWNSLPFPLTYQYPCLTRYYLFKWIYLFKNHAPSRKLEEITIQPKYQHIQQTEHTENKKISSTDMILSQTLFSDIVTDIKHFSELELINKQEVEKLQKELTEYVDYLEQLSITGEHKETGKKVSLYISRINIDLNQAYIESDLCSYSIVRFLYLSGISSVDGLKHEQMKNWLLFHKRMSTLITKTGEIEKTTFFASQREYINSLSSL